MTQPHGNAKEVVSSTRNCLRWSLTEDRALVSAMQDLLDLGGWKTDNGQFKNGAYAKFEALMEQKLPGSSSFGWNDEEKYVTCEQSVWDIWVKSHKNAAGLRNKSFPLYDDLGKIFGKDRAKGDEGECLQYALGEMEDEERNEQEEEQVSLSNTQGRSSPPPSTQEEPTPSIAHTSTRTKKARTETIVALKEFSTKLDKMSDVMEAAGEHIGRLANCFKHESESAERRMQVTSEVMKIEGLTPAEVLFASKKIAINPLEVDFFFSLPSDFKYAYVQGLLILDRSD
ncbi:hypothetical protein RND81_12G056400 [Saponaria officinalis]|uniref:Myb/SANT-like domain-containing protein n=1 Tax=Saponaria officinalis TaxID=3572 RepID=A0AAW1H608_SAPOF